MSERQKVSVPADNYGRLYIGLLESKLSSSAKLCYGVMWSFSSDCWASIPSIARRMGMSENTARSAQEELRKNKWISLLGTKEKGMKHWQLNTPSTIEGGPLQPLHPTPSTIEGGPLQPLHPKKEGNKEEKQERDSDHLEGGSPQGSGNEKWFPTSPQNSAFLQGPWAYEYKFLYDDAFEFSKASDNKAYYALQKSTVPYEDICASLKAMFADPWWSGKTPNYQERITLSNFEKHFRKFIPSKKKKAEAPISDAAMKIRKAFEDLEEKNNVKM